MPFILRPFELFFSVFQNPYSLLFRVVKASNAVKAFVFFGTLIFAYQVALGLRAIKSIVLEQLTILKLSI